MFLLLLKTYHFTNQKVTFQKQKGFLTFNPLHGPVNLCAKYQHHNWKKWENCKIEKFLLSFDSNKTMFGVTPFLM